MRCQCHIALLIVERRRWAVDYLRGPSAILEFLIDVEENYVLLFFYVLNLLLRMYSIEDSTLEIYVLPLILKNKTKEFESSFNEVTIFMRAYTFKFLFSWFLL